MVNSLQAQAHREIQPERANCVELSFYYEPHLGKLLFALRLGLITGEKEGWESILDLMGETSCDRIELKTILIQEFRVALGTWIHQEHLRGNTLAKFYYASHRPSTLEPYLRPDKYPPYCNIDPRDRYAHVLSVGIPNEVTSRPLDKPFYPEHATGMVLFAIQLGLFTGKTETPKTAINNLRHNPFLAPYECKEWKTLTDDLSAAKARWVSFVKKYGIEGGRLRDLSKDPSPILPYLKPDPPSCPWPDPKQSGAFNCHLDHLQVFSSSMHKNVMRWRLGIGENRPLGYAEVADRVGISGNRVRQIERNALKQWKDYAKTMGVKQATIQSLRENLEPIRPFLKQI